MVQVFKLAAVAVGALMLGGTASAQHHHHSHGHQHHNHGGHQHGGHYAYHHGWHFGHHLWHHVVPHYHGYTGGYYSVGPVHYYTAAPVVRGYYPAAAAPAPAVPSVEFAFGGFARQADLSGRLGVEANALCLDLHYNYRHNARFAEVYRTAYSVLQASQRIRGEDRDAIRQSVADADRALHQVQAQTRDWTRDARKPISSTVLPEKAAAVEALLHHLCFDVGVQPHGEAGGGPGQPAEIAPPPGTTGE